MPQKIPTYAEIKKAIISSLTPDLLEPKWRELIGDNAPPEAGHCAIATEALYHIAGGKEAGLIPTVCAYQADDQGMYFGPDAAKEGRHRETHWWLRGPNDQGERGKGDILDVTVGQYDEPFPYEEGRGTGFMQPQKKPSKRAQIIIDRVTEKLGISALEAFRKHQLELFQKRQKTPVPKGKTPRMG